MKIRVATVSVQFDCDDAATELLLERNFGAMSEEFGRPEIAYSLSGSAERRVSVLRTSPTQFRFEARNPGELIGFLEADLVVQVQLSRPGLLFLHAAVLELDGVAHIFAGESGAGKSTLTWGLVQAGLAYVSDELAPIDCDSGCVYGYPHALCLKKRPAGFGSGESDAFDTERGTHLPFRDRLSQSRGPYPIGKLFLVSHAMGHESPEIDMISRASASFRMYPTLLNALSHPKAGLAGLAGLTANRDCYEIVSARLGETARLVRDVLRRR